MIQLTVNSEDPDWRKMIEDLESDFASQAYLLLDSVGREVIEHLKSYTGHTKPAVGARYEWGSASGKRMRGPQITRADRPVHPGGWADISFDLMNSYAYEVTKLENGAELALLNTSDHAIFLELRNGYFVLSGITEAGGPVDLALRRAVAIFMPGATIDMGA